MILYNPTVSGSLLVTGSLTTTGTITSQTLVVQTITSSIEFVTGSTRNGSLAANTHEFTGSVLMTGSLSVVTTGTELQVNASGVNIGNALTDNHIISGSVRINPNGLFVSSSGNVGIGTSTPNAPLQVASATGTNVNPAVNITNTTLNGYGVLRLTGNSRGGFIDFYDNTSAQASIVGQGGAFYIYTNGDSSGTPKVTILADGKVGIGTDSPLNKFAVISSNTAGYYNRTEPLAVFQGLLPTVLIAHDGNSTGDYAELRLGNNQSIYYTYSPYVRGVQGAGINEYQLHFGTSNFGAATTKMIISQNGSIGAPSGTNIYNASDIRLKQNISTTTYGLSAISALNPIKFNWINGFESSEDGKDMLGFIAQEVQEVLPEAVESFGGNSITVGDTVIENPLRVNEKFIIPVLVKAIQEQQAKITTLEEILQRNNIQ